MGLYYKGVRISLSAVSREARTCDTCADVLPFKPRPVFRVGKTARLLIVGQAPGRLVHETGIPWNDPSGEVLRAWLALDREAFYDTARIAIQSALTGHLVLSTLHTNDAGSSVTRLIDMGAEDYLVTSAVNAVIAQRLVRRLGVDAQQGLGAQPLKQLRRVGD
jgi:hypothetical protein